MMKAVLILSRKARERLFPSQQTTGSAKSRDQFEKAYQLGFCCFSGIKIAASLLLHLTV